MRKRRPDLAWLACAEPVGYARNYRGGCRLEVDQVAYVNFEGIGEAAQNVKSHVHGAVLDLPNVRLARANHEGKLALGQPLLLP